jgi:hypothetical protein
MGCDYYISKDLHIYYGTNKFDYYIIELSRDKSYYYYDYDEDEENYEQKVTEYKNNCLIPNMNPITIYNNNCFMDDKFESKYIKITYS